MRFVILFLSVILGVSAAVAQTRTPVFSPALLSGPVQYNQKQRTVPANQVKAPSVAVNTTYLYFSPGQLDLTTEQKEQLIPIIKRITSGETKQIIMSGVSSSEEDSRRRLNRLSIFLRDYNRDVLIQARVVDSKNVIRNNNVVQIIEQK